MDVLLLMLSTKSRDHSYPVGFATYSHSALVTVPLNCLEGCELQASGHGGKNQRRSQMWTCFEKNVYAKSN